MSMIKENFNMKSVRVGVYFGLNEIVFVAVGFVQDKYRVLSSRMVDVGGHELGGEFELVFANELREFCRGYSKVEVWLGYMGNGCNFRHLIIPQMQVGEVSNAVFWTYKQESGFDAELEVLDYCLEDGLFLSEKGRMAVSAYSVAKSELEQFRGWVGSAGLGLSGVVLPHFAYDNLFQRGMVDVGDGAVMVLYVGMNYSAISVFDGKKKVLLRNLKSGVNAILEQLCGDAADALSVQDAWEVLLNFSEGGLDGDSHSVVGGDGSILPAELVLRDRGGGDRNFASVILQSLERLLMKIERTLEYYNGTIKGERIGRVYFVGQLSRSVWTVEFFAKNLDIDLFTFGLSECLGVDSSVLGDEGDELVWGLAMGLAVSDLQTPNLLNTKYEQDELKKRNNCFFKIFLAFLFFVSFVSFGLYVFRWGTSKKLREVANLERRLGKLGGRFHEQELLVKVVDVVKARREQREKVRVRLANAYLFDIMRITPDYVRIIDLNINLGRYDQSVVAGGISDKKRVVIQGMVVGKGDELDGRLAEYQLGLEDVFGVTGVKIRQRLRQDYMGDEVLYFSFVVSLAELPVLQSGKVKGK